MSLGAKLTAIRRVSELAPGAVLAPERYLGVQAEPGRSASTLGGEVVERREALAVAELRGALVFDTTHARDGILDVAAAARASEHPPSSAKKRFHPGDLLISRLRPYLRQVAFAAPSAFAAPDGRTPVLACSTEFLVLAPRAPRQSLAHLVPWLLSAPVQAALAAAQEGGHHPRVPREVLLSLGLFENARTAASRSLRVSRALDAFYAAQQAYQRALTAGSVDAPVRRAPAPRGRRGPGDPPR